MNVLQQVKKLSPEKLYNRWMVEGDMDQALETWEREAVHFFIFLSSMMMWPTENSVFPTSTVMWSILYNVFFFDVEGDFDSDRGRLTGSVKGSHINNSNHILYCVNIYKAGLQALSGCY